MERGPGCSGKQGANHGNMTNDNEGEGKKECGQQG